MTRTADRAATAGTMRQPVGQVAMSEPLVKHRALLTLAAVGALFGLGVLAGYLLPAGEREERCGVCERRR
jgi:hypothetical protein